MYFRSMIFIMNLIRLTILTDSSTTYANLDISYDAVKKSDRT